MTAAQASGRGLVRQDATVFNVQALRAFAALSVVYVHLSSVDGIGLPFSRGSFGVDIFFVISGYIISYMSSRDSSNFMLKRLIRVVPAYWAATLVAFILLAFFPSMFRVAHLNLELLIASLLFVPHALNGALPVLALGWTLDFEIYFYIVFAASLALSSRHPRFICIALIVLIFAVANAVALSVPILANYGAAMVLEFVFGILLFEIQHRLPARLSRFEPAGLAVLSALALAALVAAPRHVGPYRFLVLGVPAALLVGCAILLESRHGIVTRNPVILLLGDASYVLYLIHPFVLYAFTNLLFPGATHWPLVPKVLLAVCLLAATAAVAAGIHVWLEKPVLIALRERLVGRPSLARHTAAGSSVA